MTGFIRHLKSLDCYKIAVDGRYTVFENMMKTVEELFIRGVSDEIGYSLGIFIASRTELEFLRHLIML